MLARIATNKLKLTRRSNPEIGARFIAYLPVQSRGDHSCVSLSDLSFARNNSMGGNDHACMCRQITLDNSNLDSAGDSDENRVYRRRAGQLG